jgi:hypothetical protein
MVVLELIDNRCWVLHFEELGLAKGLKDLSKPLFDSNSYKGKRCV